MAGDYARQNVRTQNVDQIHGINWLRTPPMARRTPSLAALLRDDGGYGIDGQPPERMIAKTLILSR